MVSLYVDVWVGPHLVGAGAVWVGLMRIVGWLMYIIGGCIIPAHLIARQ